MIGSNTPLAKEIVRIIKHSMRVDAIEAKGVNRRSTQSGIWPWYAEEGKLWLNSEFFPLEKIKDYHTFRFKKSASILRFRCSKFVFGEMMPF